MKALWLGLAILLASCAAGPNGQSSESRAGGTPNARAHTDLGAAYYQEKKYDIALEEFNEAVKYDSNYALAYTGLGLVYAVLGEDAKADSNFKRALQLNPNNSETRNNYGAYLCSRARYDESITEFLEAVKNPLYKTPHLAYLNAGVCALKKKDEVKAEDYFKAALNLDPLSNRAAYELASIAVKRSDYISARQYLKNALFSNPSPEVLGLGVKVERVLGDKDALASYELQLRKNYPESQQTKTLLPEEQ